MNMLQGLWTEESAAQEDRDHRRVQAMHSSMFYMTELSNAHESVPEGWHVTSAPSS